MSDQAASPAEKRDQGIRGKARRGWMLRESGSRNLLSGLLVQEYEERARKWDEFLNAGSSRSRSRGGGARESSRRRRRAVGLPSSLARESSVYLLLSEPVCISRCVCMPAFDRLSPSWLPRGSTAVGGDWRMFALETLTHSLSLASTRTGGVCRVYFWMQGKQRSLSPLTHSFCRRRLPLAFADRESRGKCCSIACQERQLSRHPQ